MARTIGARIARIARRENGNDACAHGGYYSSCAHNPPHEDQPHEEWCSDFARWIWSQARVLYTDELTPAAGSFGAYGRKHGTGLHKRPRVGDAVLFNFRWEHEHGQEKPIADHVAIVVRVFPNGYIRSIGGNEVTGNFHTSYVHRDHFSGAKGYSPYWNYSISGYVSPVEDDMPYSRNQIRRYAGQGVAKELKTDTATRNEIVKLVKQGVEQELNASNTEIARKLAELKDLVQALQPATPPAAGTGDGAAGAGADAAARPV